jgi:hypothetical protein
MNVLCLFILYQAKITKIYNFAIIMRNVLYIHGMGGGGDSRIPSILADLLSADDINVIVRTYDFDPEIGVSQVQGWVSELNPELIVGESLGALQAMRVRGIPHMYVSPALNSALYFEPLAWLSLIPGVTTFFDNYYRPREGDRQPLHFTFRTLRKYRRHRKEALAASAADGGKYMNLAFFGTHDHYRRSGVVSVRSWRRLFGKDSYVMYDGTHFMEETFIRSMLVPLIREFFQGKP